MADEDLMHSRASEVFWVYGECLSEGQYAGTLTVAVWKGEGDQRVTLREAQPRRFATANVSHNVTPHV